MKREFTTVMHSFVLFADVFDLNAILPKLVSKLPFDYAAKRTDFFR